MITPSMERIKAKILATFGSKFSKGLLRDWGTYNRRKIAGSTSWSQHAWGNAWDIGCSLAEGDALVRWLKAERDSGRLPIGTILWRVKDHFDHIHVEGKPKKTGTPPVINTEADMKELIVELQKAMNAAGTTDSNGEPLKVDGVLGPLTFSALVKGLGAGASGSTVKGTFTGKVS